MSGRNAADATRSATRAVSQPLVTTVVLFLLAIVAVTFMYVPNAAENPVLMAVALLLGVVSMVVEFWIKRT